MIKVFFQFLEILKSKERKMLALVIITLFISLLLEISFLVIIIPSISLILNENPEDSQLTSKIPKNILDSIEGEFVITLLAGLIFINIIKFLFSSIQIFFQNLFVFKSSVYLPPQK
jgi:ABC-type multidrug transport system fused ATPase/permease subunit